jgi:hypothetical protein
VSVVITTVSVTPPNASLVEGDTLTVRAIVTDDRGGSLGGVPVAWSVGDSAIVSIDSNGLVTALSSGATTIRAEFREVFGEATFTVIPAPRIAVDPETLAFYGGVLGASIPPQVVSITNAGGDRLRGLDFEVRYGEGQPADWLDVSLAGQIDPTTMTVTPVPEGLPAGQFSADILITSTSSQVANSPVTVPVTLSLSEFTVVETEGSTVVDEAGSQDSFSVALAKQPSSDVVLLVTSGDTGEVTVSPAELTFTPADWDVPQVVTVTGVDDFIDDGDVQTSITISVDDARSDDVFDPTPDLEVVVTTLDDDEAGVTVAATNGSTVVTEAGGKDTLTVVLETEPAALVVIDVSSQDTGEASVTPDQLSFDASNWSVPQIVTVTGVDDFVIDGAVETDVVVEVNDVATFGPYASVPAQAVSVTTQDDDVGAIILSKETAAVNETGTVDSVRVTLSVMPDSAVVLGATSDDTGEVTVSPATVTIQPSEWNVGKSIRFTGVNDQLSDGPQVATVTVSVVTADSDGDLDPAPDVTVDVTNEDDDSPGFTVSETGGGTTVSESGTTDGFQVVLRTQPQPGTEVVLDIVSPDLDEVTVSPGMIQFDDSNWDTPRTVTVTGVDDGEDDGDGVTDVEISVGADTSDPDYASVPAQTVSVTTIETKLLVEELGGGTTVVSESGTNDRFDVALSHRPSSNVVVSVVSDDPGEVTVDKAQLTFTPANWSTEQTVTVEGVDDLVDDGDEETDVRLTVVNGPSDPIFHDVAHTVVVTTTDNDGAGIEVIELGGTVVTENGGDDDFGVRLTAQPAPGRSVVLDVSSGDVGEVTVDKAQLTFTPGNWNQHQLVTVTGVPDNTVDGDQHTDVTLSVNLAGTTDPAYISVSDRIVSVTTEDIDVAAVTVNNASATEGGGVMFSVTLSDAVQGGLSVDVTLTDGTAVAPADYNPVVGTLNFSGTAGEVEQFTVSTVSDAIVEADETFSVSLDASHPGVTDSDTGTGTINDNDASTVTVNNAVTTEGGDLTFTVTLGNAVQGGLSVIVALSGGTATGGATPLITPEDYDNVVAPLIFAGTASETKQFTVATLDDAIFEGNETFTVSLSASHASVTDSDTGTGTINDNDMAAVTVDNASAEEGEDLTFTVTLNNAVAGALTVDVTLTDVSATGGPAPLVAPEDYDNVVSQLTFGGTAGETEQFTVETLDDAIFEGTETFTVSLSASNGAVIDSDTGTGTITDNDIAPTVTLSANPLSLNEGSGIPSVVTATLSHPTTQSVTVNLGFAGTASEGDDYTSSGTQIVIPALATSRSIEIDAVDDAVDELDKEVMVSISNVLNGTEAVPQQVTITIVDDDVAGLSINNASVTEGDAGTTNMNFTVSLSAASEQTVTVDWATANGTATAPADYTADSDQLTFTAGDTQETITVAVQGDLLDEGASETFNVNLSNPVNATISDGTGVGTITDDDSAPSVTLSADVSTLDEDGSDSPATVTATLSNPSALEVTVNLQFSGSAMSPADYTQSGTSIVIPAGSTSEFIEIDAVQDAVDEPNETVIVSITTVMNGTESGTQQVTVTIVDDDTAPSLSISNESVTEGDAGTTNMVFTVTLSAASAQTVTVDWATANGTATAPADYTADSDQLTFTAGDTEETITVAVQGDLLDEGVSEMFEVNLSGESNATISDATGEGTITDDDDPPSLSISDESVTEGDAGTTDMVFTVTLSAASGQTVTVDWATADGTATAPADYTADSDQLTFTAGDTEETITVAVQGDLLDEGVSETFNVNLSGASSATISDATGEGTITDDDDAP